ncbi:MAG: Gfo/Idh/MocA family oxidoreductase [bacterium]|nr:Gfo/Idh/MocA family oxidoreductase [bacterium]
MMKFGVIGCGWYGNLIMEHALRLGAEATALCDVDSDQLDKAADTFEKAQGARPAVYKDYRDLLDHEGLDVAVIATPTQWHALQFIAACDKGLDIYCEKPFSYDIREGQAMLAAHEQAGNVVAIGFQRRQLPVFHAVKQFIEEGGAGRIVQVDAQIHYHATPKDATPQDPPASLDWDAWCGPAPLIPYSPNVGHHSWRLERTTGHGHLVDWGIHLIDAIRFILDESMPTAVTTAGGCYALDGQITTPDTLTAHLKFERCPVTWRHRLWGAAEVDSSLSNCIVFYGGEATVLVKEDEWTVIPCDSKEERQTFTPDADVDVQALHVQDFVDAVRSRRAPCCTAYDGHCSTATVNLAMIAFEAGEGVVWDDAAGELKGSEAARSLLRRDYRQPWIHPDES